MCKFGGSRPNSIEDRDLTKNLNQGKWLSNLRGKVGQGHIRVTHLGVVIDVHC